MIIWTARQWCCAFGAMSCVAFGALSLVLAGDTNPPPGPLMGTMKTLEEVEPRINVNMLPGDATAVHVISQAGSYMLTADVIGQAGKNGIKISADIVTLDLSGFALSGSAGSLSGIKVEIATVPDWTNIAGGTIESWGGHAIDATGSMRTDLRDLMIVNCAGGGVVAGDSATVSYVMVEDCGGDGISVGADSMVGHSTAINVTGAGLTLGDGTMCLNSMVNGTGGFGLVGLNSKLRDCMIHSAGTDGLMLLGTNGQVDGCEIKGSGGRGIVAGSGARIDGCSIGSSGQDGIVLAGDRASVRRCMVTGSGGNGLTTDGIDHRISESTFAANIGHGVQLQANASGVTLSGVTAGSNTLNGIMMDGQYQIAERCTVTGNGAGAVLADGAGCVVRDCSISADGVSTSALVRIGDAGVLAACAIDVSNSTFIDAPVHFSGTKGSFLDCTVSATGVTATPSIVACGWIDGDWNRDRVSARDCTLTMAIVSVQGSATSIHGGSVRATGITSAPAATSIMASLVDWGDFEQWLTPMVPIGLDVVGSSCTIDAGAVLGVGAGGRGIRVSGGNGSTVKGCRISGDGSGPYTGVDVQSMGNVVIANDISALLGGMAVDNVGGPSNLIGPTINAGNLGSGCDPCGNIVH